MIRQATLNEILDSRERRAATQKKLISLYGTPLVSFSMNIPGAQKDSMLIRAGFAEGLRRLAAAVSAGHKEERYSVTGPEAYLCVGMDPTELKKITAGLEEADALGRLFDMDVIRPEGSAVSRSELGLPLRRCFLCGEPARICRRANSHTTEELRAAAITILKDALPAAGLGELLADFACAALKAELDTTPKPGLVDRYNSGSHRDMNYSIFCRSIEALRPYFVIAAGLGTECLSADETFGKLREAGKAAEREMFAATGGVNTHKGAIFSLGICVCAAARVLTGRFAAETMPASEEESFQPLTEEILDECSRLAKGICARDFDSVTRENAVTAGEKLYARFGLAGARGQAEAGFPAVREAGLPVYRQVLARTSAGTCTNVMKNTAACTALLAILCHTADTNLLKRGGREKAEEVTGRIRRLLKLEDGSPAEPADGSFIRDSAIPGIHIPGERELLLLDADFIRDGLSPGGSADLLAVTIFLHELAGFLGEK